MRKIRSLLRPIKKIIFRCLPDKTYIKLTYPVINGKKLDIEHPETYNEKLQWLKLHDRNPLYPQLVDKYEVQKYVSNKIGNEYLIPLLGVWNRVNEIDFSELPSSFVLKCTHDSGSVIICKDKLTFSIEDAKKKLKKALKRNIYYTAREWPYKNVKPRIIAQQYLTCIAEELLDYKIFCFNGKVKMIEVDFNKETNHTVNLYTRDWEYIPVSLRHPTNPNFIIEKPKNLNEMIDIAEILSNGIPHIRVDLYNVGNKIYFGELTCYPHKGTGVLTPSSFDKEMGKWLDLLPLRQKQSNLI